MLNYHIFILSVFEDDYVWNQKWYQVKISSCTELYNSNALVVGSLR